MPICLRRLSPSHNIFSPSLSIHLPRIRFNSSPPRKQRPRIQVTSRPPQSNRPTNQQHKWSSPPNTHSPINTSNHSQGIDTNNPHPQDPQAPSSIDSTSPDPRNNSRIRYNQKETRLRNLLQKTENHINKTRSPEEQISIFYVGGWVRDKLLGKSPRDIDVVLQNITPKEFVQSLIDHHSFDSHSARLLPSTIDVSQSTGDASDLSIGTYDFEYDSGDGKTFQVAGIYFFSLTMKMEFTQLKASQSGGDIELLTQDAMQRELTINAIYQKLSNSEILDFTGRGIDDLRKRVLRCPRGKQNIVDDPLRVLRIIRLASRFFFEGFVIEKETLDAMMDPDIRLALKTRFPIARIHKEVSMILKPIYHPHQVLRYLYETNYYRDTIIPPLPPSPPKEYIPPSVSPEDISMGVTSSYFIDKLSRTWDFWAPFEQALLHIPSTTHKQPNYNTPLGLSIVRQNILQLMYAICAVMPWLRYPDSPASSEAKTYAGEILQQMGRLLKPWKLVDEIFSNPEGALRAVERVLNKDVSAGEVREEFGEFWGVWVLMGLMMEWNGLCQGRVGVSEMEALWQGGLEHWIRVSEGVDRIRWEGGSPVNGGMNRGMSENRPRIEKRR